MISDPLLPGNGGEHTLYLHERLLSLRLADIGEQVQLRYPALSDSTGFSETWSALCDLPAGWIAEAVRQPLFADWVASVERLLDRGVFGSYPGVEPANRLRSISILAMSWARGDHNGLSGTIPLRGRYSLPLDFGRRRIVLQPSLVGDIIDWKVRDGCLRLVSRLSNLVVDIDLVNGFHAEGRGVWCLRTLPTVHGLLLDPWTIEYQGGCQTEDPVDHKMLADLVTKAMAQLGRPAGSIVQTYLRVVSECSDAVPWIAGLAYFDASAGAGPGKKLLELALRDCLYRRIEVSSPALACAQLLADDHLKLLVQLAALVLVDQFFDRPVNSAVARELASHLDHLCGSPGQSDLTAALGLSTEPRQAIHGGNGGGLVSSKMRFDEIFSLTGVQSSSVTALQMRKQRRGTSEEVDWSTLDAWLAFTSEELACLFNISSAYAEASEEAAVCMALSSYLRSDFDICCGALARCLEFDPDVEQYWVLLAFAYRHLGKTDRFDAIVFDNLGGGFLRRNMRRSLQ